MMKNIGARLTTCLIILCLGLLLGTYIGSVSPVRTVELSSYDKKTSEQNESSTTFNENYGKININTATAEELTMLPGIGETYAQRIVEFRNKYGLFLRIKDITKVKGIGEERFESIKDYITVGG